MEVMELQLFQIVKDDAVKILYSQYVNKFGKFSSGHRTGKVFIAIPKKGNAKEYSNSDIVVPISPGAR